MYWNTGGRLGETACVPLKLEHGPESLSPRGGEEGSWRGSGSQAPTSPADSYLGLAGHAQEEAEGSSQGGAYPGVRTPFQMATAAEGEGRGEKILQRDGGGGCHDKEKGSGDMRGKTQKKGEEGKGRTQRKDTPHPHLLGLPGCEGLVFQAPLFMRRLQAPPR